MKKLILLVMLLISIQITTATYEKIHENWHPYQDQITKENRIYTFQILETNPEILRFTAQNFTTLIRKGQCIKDNNYNYCYQDFDFEHKETTISPSGNLVPGIKILIEKDTYQEQGLKSEFKPKITHTARLEVNQKGNITINLENNGQTNIQDLKITATMLNNLEMSSNSLTKLQTIMQSQNTLLRPNTKQTHIIEITPKRSGIYDIKIDIEYTEQGQKKQITETKRIEVPKPYTITKTAPNTVQIGQTFDFEITIENKIETPLTIDLNVQNPLQLTVQRNQNLNLQSARIYKNTLTLEQGQKQTFKITYNPTSPSTQSIIASAKITVNGQTYEEPLNHIVNIQNKGITSTLTTDKTDAISNSPLLVTYTLKNNNDNIELEAITEIEGLIQKQITTTLRPGETKTILQERITLPETNQNIAEKITTSTRYRISGTLYTTNNEKTVNILGDSNPVLLTITPSKQTANPNEIITITVTARNLADNSILALNIKDELNQNLNLISGRQTNTIDLQGKQQIQAYTYQIETKNEDIVVITTAKNSNLETNAKTIIKIDGSYIEETITPNQTLTTKEIINQIEVVRQDKEESTVVRLYRSFTNFIRGIIS